MAKAIFTKFDKYFLRQELPLNLRLHVIKCYIWPVLLCGAEIWSLNIKSLNRIEAFEMASKSLLYIQIYV